MNRRVLHGLCGVAIVGFLTIGSDAHGRVGTRPTSLTEQSRSPQGRAAQARPLPAMVPDLSGSTEQVARALLTKARLRVGDITSVEADVRPGTVVRQDRPAGSRVPVGTLVAFVLAIPVAQTQPPPATVPDLRSEAQRVANALRTKARLRVGD